MSESEVKLRITGLYSHPDPFSEVPEGALEVADNVVIDRESVISPRRGLNQLTGDLSAGNANSITEYEDQLIAQYSTNKLAYYKTSNDTWTDYSTSIAPITGRKTKFVHANSNLYMTTDAGVYKLDSYTGTPSAIGVPKAIDVAVATYAGGSFLTENDIVAYRIVWGIKDSNDNVHLGAPSQRAVFTTAVTGATTDGVTVTIQIPSGITTDHFVQIYRSAVGSTAPNDELYLVYEANPSGAQITAKVMVVEEDRPTDLTGATLYTSPSQEGILQSNDQAPLAEDIAVFKNFTFFAKTTSRHSYKLTLLGLTAPGLIATDTVVLDTGESTVETYTAVASGATGKQFNIATAGSVAQDIEDTALNLIAAINAESALVYAYYVSGTEDLPGQIRIEERSLGGSGFTVTVNNEVAWSYSGNDSINDAWLNGLFYSKSGQPEAVPLTNYVRVGSADDPILRIAALRDSLFIFKSTEGIYRLYGDDPSNFKVDLFDSSANLLAPETLAILNNTVYGYFDQGVSKVSEVGVSVISRPIEKTFLELQGTILSSIKSYAWGMSYESDRKYILHLPEDSLDTYTTQAYVWNTFTSTWTRWTMNKSCGFVRPSEDKMYVGSASDQKVSYERKSFNFTDIVDESFAVTISTVDEKSIGLVTAGGIVVGDILWEDSDTFATVSAIDRITETITVSEYVDFTTGAAKILSAYQSDVKWHAFTAGEPLKLKHFRETSLLFDKSYKTGTLTFTTESSLSEDIVTVTGNALGLWGLFEWGSVPWGGRVGSKILRTYVPSDKARASHLYFRFKQTIGYNDFALNGAQVIFNTIGEKVDG